MIKDSVYLVSGGASGLGKGVAEKLLVEGAKVAILDLQMPPENDSLRQYGDQVLFFQVDVSSEKEVLNAIDATKRRFEKLNGVICCASVCQYHPLYDFEKKEPHSLQEFSTIINIIKCAVGQRRAAEKMLKIDNTKLRPLDTGQNIATKVDRGPLDFKNILGTLVDVSNGGLKSLSILRKVNLVGTFNVIRLSIPLLIENELNEKGERGIIITTSSVAGHHGRPNLLAYSASKAGIIGMTYPLAKELNGHGIRVVDLAPGSYDTPMFQDVMTYHKKGEVISSKILGEPSDFGNFVISVINTSMLNGTSVRLDGGLKK